MSGDVEVPIKVTVEAVLTHEYFLCFYGVLLWYLFLAVIENKIKHGLVLRDWWRRNVLDIVVTLAIAPLIVVFDDEIIDLYNNTIEDDIELGSLVYLMGGPVYNFLLRLVTGFIKK